MVMELAKRKEGDTKEIFIFFPEKNWIMKKKMTQMKAQAIPYTRQRKSKKGKKEAAFKGMSVFKL